MPKKKRKPSRSTEQAPSDVAKDHAEPVPKKTKMTSKERRKAEREAKALRLQEEREVAERAVKAMDKEVQARKKDKDAERKAAMKREKAPKTAEQLKTEAEEKQRKRRIQVDRIRRARSQLNSILN